MIDDPGPEVPRGPPEGRRDLEFGIPDMKTLQLRPMFAQIGLKSNYFDMEQKLVGPIWANMAGGPRRPREASGPEYLFFPAPGGSSRGPRAVKEGSGPLLTTLRDDPS